MGIELELHSERPAFHNWRAARVDPYGNTLLNEQEAEAALLEHCVSGSEAAAVRDLAALLQSCASTPGSHLWFIGD